MWIERGQNTAGGPIAYFDDNTTWWFNTLGTSADVATDVMSEALLVSLATRHTVFTKEVDSYIDAIMS